MLLQDTRHDTFLVRDFLYTLSAEDKGPAVSSKHRDQVSSVQAAALPRTLRQARHQQDADGTILLQLHTATPARQAGGLPQELHPHHLDKAGQLSITNEILAVS